MVVRVVGLVVIISTFAFGMQPSKVSQVYQSVENKVLSVSDLADQEIVHIGEFKAEMRVFGDVVLPSLEQSYASAQPGVERDLMFSAILHQNQSAILNKAQLLHSNIISLKSYAMGKEIDHLTAQNIQLLVLAAKTLKEIIQVLS